MGRGRGATTAETRAGGSGARPSAAALIPGTPYTRTQLKRVADNALDNLVQTSAGDVLVLEAGEEHRPYVAAIEASARRRGVEVLDRSLHSGDFAELIDRDAAFLTLLGADDDAPLLDAEDFALWDDEVDEPVAMLDSAIDANQVRWALAHLPTPSWAVRVYPALAGTEALRRLGQDLLEFSWLSDADAPMARQERMAELRRRADALNRAQISQLRFGSAGSELTVRLLPESRFLPCEWKTARGRSFSCNDPTDEIFSTPDASSAEGHVTTTRPAMVAGRLIPAGIRLEFTQGELVTARAADPADQQVLDEHFWGPAADVSRRRIGEIGILDRDSRVARSGRTFHEPVIDEQSGTHLGLGSSYDVALSEDGSAERPAGANTSDSHVDFTFGDLSLDISALATGDEEPLPVLCAGAWSLPTTS